jgi:hypothetical protein
MSSDNRSPRAVGTMHGESRRGSPDCARSNRDPILPKYPMPCEESRRLTDVYLAAVSHNNEAASVMAAVGADGWRHDAWREEMKDIRAACEKALDALDQHKREHGC